MSTRHEEVLARLRRFEELERKNTDEVGWIALAYSCSRAKAEKMIRDARAFAEKAGGQRG